LPAIIDAGRELEGVPFGVSLGVVDALPPLALRAPERGVTLLLRRCFAGGVASSLDVFTKGRGGACCRRPRSGDVLDVASRGATSGPVLDRCSAAGCAPARPAGGRLLGVLDMFCEDASAAVTWEVNCEATILTLLLRGESGMRLPSERRWRWRARGAAVGGGGPSLLAVVDDGVGDVDIESIKTRLSVISAVARHVPSHARRWGGYLHASAPPTARLTCTV
jgi:hypothetical protein